MEALMGLLPRPHPLVQLGVARVERVRLEGVAHGKTSLGRTIGQWTTSPEFDTRTFSRLGGLDMTQPTSRDQAPGPCPACGESHPAKILYGYLFWNDGLEEAIDRGEITLGGCVIGTDDPAWRCNKCGHQWGLSYR
jgi:hypothetical protein